VDPARAPDRSPVGGIVLGDALKHRVRWSGLNSDAFGRR